MVVKVVIIEGTELKGADLHSKHPNSGSVHPNDPIRANRTTTPEEKKKKTSHQRIHIIPESTRPLVNPAGHPPARALQPLAHKSKHHLAIDSAPLAILIINSHKAPLHARRPQRARCLARVRRLPALLPSRRRFNVLWHASRIVCRGCCDFIFSRMPFARWQRPVDAAVAHLLGDQVRVDVAVL
jgi:hypothetical protein